MINSTKDYVNRQDRMIDKLSSKMQQSIGRRADMYVEDSEAIDNNSCRIMVAYAKHLGPVTTDQLEEFIIREFNGKVIPSLATAQSFSDLGRVMVVVNRTNVTRPVDDTKNMHCVASAVYIDKELNDTWEVMTAEDGARYLQRVASDDINSIVSERRRRMSTAGEQPFTITAALNTFGGTLHTESGDTVRVVYKGSVHADCMVTSVGEREVSVKIPQIGTVTVPIQAIDKIQQVNAKRVNDMAKKLDEYYTEIYGPEYAELLTRETTQD